MGTSSSTNRSYQYAAKRPSTPTSINDSFLRSGIGKASAVPSRTALKKISRARRLVTEDWGWSELGDTVPIPDTATSPISETRRKRSPTLVVSDQVTSVVNVETVNAICELAASDGRTSPTVPRCTKGPFNAKALDRSVSRRVWANRRRG